jgi:hypothetical protein
MIIRGVDESVGERVVAGPVTSVLNLGDRVVVSRAVSAAPFGSPVTWPVSLQLIGDLLADQRLDGGDDFGGMVERVQVRANPTAVAEAALFVQLAAARGLFVNQDLSGRPDDFGVTHGSPSGASPVAGGGQHAHGVHPVLGHRAARSGADHARPEIRRMGAQVAASGGRQPTQTVQ